MRSHKKALLKTNADYILILEDDFILCENFDTELLRCINELPVSFEVLWLGGRVVGGCENYSERLNRIKFATGLYGVLINSKFKTTMLEALSKENKLADWCLNGIAEKCFMSKNKLIKHSSGYSYIQNKEVNYIDLA